MRWPVGQRRVHAAQALSWLVTKGAAEGPGSLAARVRQEVSNAGVSGTRRVMQAKDPP